MRNDTSVWVKAVWPDFLSPHDMALELVCWDDLWCKRHWQGEPRRSGGLEWIYGNIRAILHARSIACFRSHFGSSRYSFGSKPAVALRGLGRAVDHAS